MAKNDCEPNSPASVQIGFFFVVFELDRSHAAAGIMPESGGFEPDRVLSFVATERVTVLPFLAPTMIVRLLEADPAFWVPELRAIVYGGAPIHLQHLRAALQRFGSVLTQLYGQGESRACVRTLSGSRPAR
jgi:acyl-CoA synthetase (AMP-forming)/AMP-acid ligase II